MYFGGHAGSQSRFTQDNPPGVGLGPTTRARGHCAAMASIPAAKKPATAKKAAREEAARLITQGNAIKAGRPIPSYAKTAK